MKVERKPFKTKEELYEYLFGEYERNQPRKLKAFGVWVRKNDLIRQYFALSSARLMKSGRDHYGARMIMEKIRFHLSKKWGKEDGFRVPNNYVPLMPRLLIYFDQSFLNFFELRRPTGHDIPEVREIGYDGGDIDDFDSKGKRH